MVEATKQSRGEAREGSFSAQADAQAEAVEHLAILFQRRYNVLRDLKKATEDLSEALGRNDEVSARLMLKIRRDYLEKCDASWQEICLLPEDQEIYRPLFPRLVQSDPEEVKGATRMEEKLLEVRRHCRGLIREIQQRDRILNLRSIKDKSIYAAR